MAGEFFGGGEIDRRHGGHPLLQLNGFAAKAGPRIPVEGDVHGDFQVGAGFERHLDPVLHARLKPLFVGNDELRIVQVRLFGRIRLELDFHDAVFDRRRRRQLLDLPEPEVFLIRLEHRLFQQRFRCGSRERGTGAECENSQYLFHLDNTPLSSPSDPLSDRCITYHRKDYLSNNSIISKGVRPTSNGSPDASPFRLFLKIPFPRSNRFHALPSR